MLVDKSVKIIWPISLSILSRLATYHANIILGIKLEKNIGDQPCPGCEFFLPNQYIQCARYSVPDWSVTFNAPNNLSQCVAGNENSNRYPNPNPRNSNKFQNFLEQLKIKEEKK